MTEQEKQARKRLRKLQKREAKLRRQRRKSGPPQAGAQRIPSPARRRRTGGGRLLRRLMLLGRIALRAGLSALAFYAAQNLLVSAVRVEGDSVYEAGDVQAASGLAAGQRLLLLKPSAIEQQVRDMLPYLEQVEVARHLNASVTIEVTAAKPLYRVEGEAGPCDVSETGRLLGAHPKAAELPLPLVRAGFMRPLVIGQHLEFEAKNDGAMCVDILTALQDNKILDRTHLIEMTDKLHLRLMVDGRIEVQLGDSINLPGKIQLAAISLPTLEGKTGKLDAANTSRAIFTPAQASQAATQERLTDQPQAEPAAKQTD